MGVFLSVIIYTALIVFGLVLSASIFFFFYACIRNKPKFRCDYLKDPDSPWTNNFNKIKNIEEGLLELEYKDLEINSFDGLKLCGEIYTPKEKVGNKVALLMHGFRSHNRDDVMIACEMFLKNGYSVAIVSQRTHGKSQGKFITFGIKERYDCKNWCEELVKICGINVQICLFGVSMGAATVLMASGLALPKQVKAIVADCGFTSPYDIYKHVLKRDYKLPAFPILNVAGIFTRLIAGFSFREYSVKEAMKENKVPVLFIHGDKDTFVPTWMSKENYRNCNAKKELLIIKDAVHAVSFLTKPKKCKTVMFDFLEESFSS